uniref:hypothetical protein n=1 Tax=Polynucleobacter sp. TaxID=2029855 RepID=UPI0040484BF0
MSTVMRGRSMSRSSGAGAAGRGRKRSISVLSTRSSASSRGGKWGKMGDGPTLRAYPRAQSNSQFFDPFPRTMRAVLRYSTVVDFNAVTGAASLHFLRAGSIFDPDYTGVGYQPYGHDTYQTIYNHYRVIKSVCKITNTTAGQNNVIGLLLSDDVSVSNDIDMIRTIKPSKFLPLVTTTEPHSLQMTYNSEQSFPGQRSTTTALFGNNPAEEQYFCVSVSGSGPLSDPGAISVAITMEYYVEFSELKALGKS